MFPANIMQCYVPALSLSSSPSLDPWARPWVPISQDALYRSIFSAFPRYALRFCCITLFVFYPCLLLFFSNGFTTTFLLKVQCKVNEWSLLTDTAEQRKLPALKSSLNLKWSFLPFTWSIKRTEYSHKNVYLQSVFHSKVLFTLSRKCVWFTFKPLARQDKCIG